MTSRISEDDDSMVSFNTSCTKVASLTSTAAADALPAFTIAASMVSISSLLTVAEIIAARSAAFCRPDSVELATALSAA